MPGTLNPTNRFIDLKILIKNETQTHEIRASIHKNQSSLYILWFGFAARLNRIESGCASTFHDHIVGSLFGLKSRGT